MYDHQVRLTRLELENYPGNERPTKMQEGKERYYCPIHGSDRQRSLQLNLRNGHFKCYACGCWGYLEEYRQAFITRRRGKAAHIRQPLKVSQNKDTRLQPQRDLTSILRGLQLKLESSIAIQYLKARRIPLSIAKRYGWGYAPFGMWPHQKNGQPIRQWRLGRIVAPHQHPTGRIINLYGRAVGNHHVPKQYRHAHLPGEKGIFNVQALTEETVFICEGAFDALSLITAGYPNTCAIFGAYGMRWDWLKAKTIVFCLDPDQGGNAWVSHAREAQKRGKQIYHLSRTFYGRWKDLNEVWIKKGKIDMQFIQRYRGG